jgi:hypothetical protein
MKNNGTRSSCQTLKISKMKRPRKYKIRFKNQRPSS